jgi:hypothetical protein
MPKIQEALLQWFASVSNRTLLDKTLNGDESMCFGATMCCPDPVACLSYFYF